MPKRWASCNELEEYLTEQEANKLISDYDLRNDLKQED